MTAAPPLRVHAIYAVLDEVPLFRASVASVYPFVSGITVITAHDRDWMGEQREASSLVATILDREIDPERKIDLIVTSEINEARARNRAMDYAAPRDRSVRVVRQHDHDPGFTPPDYFLIIDADEIYEATDLQRLIDVRRARPAARLQSAVRALLQALELPHRRLRVDVCVRPCRLAHPAHPRAQGASVASGTGACPRERPSVCNHDCAASSTSRPRSACSTTGATWVREHGSRPSSSSFGHAHEVRTRLAQRRVGPVDGRDHRLQSRVPRTVPERGTDRHERVAGRDHGAPVARGVPGAMTDAARRADHDGCDRRVSPSRALARLLDAVGDPALEVIVVNVGGDLEVGRVAREAPTPVRRRHRREPRVRGRGERGSGGRAR